MDVTRLSKRGGRAGTTSLLPGAVFAEADLLLAATPGVDVREDVRFAVRANAYLRTIGADDAVYSLPVELEPWTKR